MVGVPERVWMEQPAPLGTGTVAQPTLWCLSLMMRVPAVCPPCADSALALRAKQERHPARLLLTIPYQLREQLPRTPRREGGGVAWVGEKGCGSDW